jgi:hypothetical protein
LIQTHIGGHSVQHVASGVLQFALCKRHTLTQQLAGEFGPVINQCIEVSFNKVEQWHAFLALIVWGNQPCMVFPYRLWPT